MIDVATVAAIDVHVHTERTRAGHDPMPAELRQAAVSSDRPSWPATYSSAVIARCSACSSRARFE